MIIKRKQANHRATTTTTAKTVVWKRPSNHFIDLKMITFCEYLGFRKQSKIRRSNIASPSRTAQPLSFMSNHKAIKFIYDFLDSFFSSFFFCRLSVPFLIGKVSNAFHRLNHSENDRWSNSHSIR